MLNAPVLQLDAARMHEIDPRNVESLFGMWTVFSRCSSTIPNGKRLENLSWRVWARETLCCPPQPEKSIVPAIDIPQSSSTEVPSLSNSVASDDSDTESISSRSSQCQRSFSSSEDSALSKSRGNEPHLTPLALEKMVVNIKEKTKLEPLSPAMEAVVNSKIQSEAPKLNQRQSNLSEQSDPRPSQYSTESSCISTATTDTRTTERQVEHRNSDTSVSSDGIIRSGSVVHGFSPVQPSSLRSRSALSQGLPVLATKNAANKNLAPQKSGMFTLGGSSEDDESSFEQHMSFKRGLHEPRKSSLSQAMHSGPPSKKATSFKDIVEQRRVQEASENDEGAIASSDEEDDDIDDSAIEEEDDGDWEDSPSDDDKPLHENVFKRIDSRANLTSRRSILTQGLNEGDRAKGLLNAATRSSPAIRRAQSQTGPSMPVSNEENEDDGGMMMQAPKGTRPLPIIATTSNTYAIAHSPRTTRRNMLSTELTESLRKNLLWERQQKNTTVNAFLKREARSMANLPKAGNNAVPPTHRTLVKDPSKNNHSYNDYFNVTNEYHTKGW